MQLTDKWRDGELFLEHALRVTQEVPVDHVGDPCVKHYTDINPAQD